MKKNNIGESIGEVLLFFAVMVFTFAAGGALGRRWYKNEIQKQAIENGVAYWHVDPKGDGKPEFRWRKIETGVKEVTK